MNYGKMLGQYQRTRVETAGKIDLVVLCYEKVIESLIKAKSFYEEKQYEQKAIWLERALNIINELQASIDFEQGGNIAGNLDNIYSYLTKRLLLGDYNMDLTAFDEAIRIMNGLKGAWEDIASKSEDQVNPASIATSIAINASQLAA